MINYYELVKNNPDYFKQFSCKDLLFLNYDCPVKLKKVAKWSEHHYIYYVLAGKKTLHTTDSSITLTKGSIAFIRKGACIVEQFFEEVFCVVVFIIPDSFIVSFLDDYLPGEQPAAASKSLIIPVYDDVRIQSFYQSLAPYFSSDEIPEALLELKFRELMLHILHNPQNKELKNYFLSLRSEKSSPLKEIMEANYAYNLSIEAYAKLTNRSVSSFKRDFQALYQTTPGRWLIEKKLERARRLLLKGNESIASVAFESGFENAAHFSRLFKQKTGLTPLQFRKHLTDKVSVTN
jgi:AraC family transcriptional regulator, exoenzyme S synthesis regulatory protein ExsA